MWLLIRMALNALDGMLAREFGQKSPLGAYLNELGDVVSDAALYAPFALIAPFEPLGIGGVIVLAVISEFAGALGPMVGASRHYEGPMGKSDRAVVFGALAVWIGGGGALPDWLGLLIPMLAGLLVLTAINRVRGGLAELSEAAAPSIAQPAVVLPLRPVEEGLFETHDNARLFYRFWPAISGPPKGAVVLFHRGHEHGGRIAHLVDELDLPEFAFFAWDARGHGRSPGQRGYSPSLGASVRDVQSFIAHIASAHGIARRTSRSSGKASERCWLRPGCMIMRPTSAAWCWPRRPSRSSSTCRSPASCSSFATRFRDCFSSIATSRRSS